MSGRRMYLEELRTPGSPVGQMSCLNKQYGAEFAFETEDGEVGCACQTKCFFKYPTEKGARCSLNKLSPNLLAGRDYHPLNITYPKIRRFVK